MPLSKCKNRENTPKTCMYDKTQTKHVNPDRINQYGLSKLGSTRGLLKLGLSVSHELFSLFDHSALI